jgi:peptidoglycan/xylan/chitin deacetylase (PgdA/CDA1 family)
MKSVYLIILFPLFFFTSIKAEQINIVFRYDDVMLHNDSTDIKVICLFQKHHIPLVLGAIPCDANEKTVIDPHSPFLAALKESVRKGEIEIALHGLTHQRMTPYGEFKGLSFEEQNRRIQKGKQFLDSVFRNQTVTFIPPWNAHDDNTVKALKKNGISIVSSSIYDIWTEAAYYPMSTSDFRELEGLILNNQIFGGVGVVMMHRYDFTSLKSLNELDKTLTLLRQTQEVHFYTFRQLKQEGISINTVQSEDLKRQNLLSKLIHQKGIFISQKDITVIKLINATIYLLMFCLVYLIAQAVLLKRHRHNSIQTIVLALAGILVFCSTWFYWWGPLKLIFCTMLFALILTWIFRFFKVYDFVIKMHIERKKV